MSELDNRIGDYAAAIVRDADLLLADAAHLNNEQLNFVSAIKRTAGYILDLYTDYTSASPEFDTDNYAFSLRPPLSNIAGYCELLGRTDEFGSLSEAQLQRLNQIQASQQLMRHQLDRWRDAEVEKRRNSGTR